jgi:hypothetical protein
MARVNDDGLRRREKWAGRIDDHSSSKSRFKTSKFDEFMSLYECLCYDKSFCGVGEQ